MSNPFPFAIGDKVLFTRKLPYFNMKEEYQVWDVDGKEVKLYDCDDDHSWIHIDDLRAVKLQVGEYNQKTGERGVIPNDIPTNTITNRATCTGSRPMRLTANYIEF